MWGIAVVVGLARATSQILTNMSFQTRKRHPFHSSKRSSGPQRSKHISDAGSPGSTVYECSTYLKLCGAPMFQSQAQMQGSNVARSTHLHTSDFGKLLQELVESMARRVVNFQDTLNVKSSPDIRAQSLKWKQPPGPFSAQALLVGHALPQDKHGRNKRQCPYQGLISGVDFVASPRTIDHHRPPRTRDQ